MAGFKLLIVFKVYHGIVYFKYKTIANLCYYFFLQERDLGDEYGWKQVHGDVFRMPTLPTLLSSLVGCGYHLTAVTLVVIGFVIMGDLYMG